MYSELIFDHADSKKFKNGKKIDLFQSSNAFKVKSYLKLKAI